MFEPFATDATDDDDETERKDGEDGDEHVLRESVDCLRATLSAVSTACASSKRRNGAARLNTVLPPPALPRGPFSALFSHAPRRLRTASTARRPHTWPRVTG